MARTPPQGVSLGERASLLARTSRRDGGWVYSEFQMAEDLAGDLTLRDDGDEPQGPALTPWAVYHIQRKDPMQQPCPAPVRHCGVCHWLVEALPTSCLAARSPPAVVPRYTAP